jgi:hypothetical protein
MSNKEFTLELKKRGFIVKPSHGTDWWHGLDLAKDGNEELATMVSDLL